MRLGVSAIGILLIFVGILLVLFFWPLVDYETQDTFRLEDVKGKDTKRYVGEITEVTEFGEVYILELDDGVLEAYTREKDFELNDNVLVTIEFGENTTNWDENTYRVQKIPTLEGSLGAIFLIFGSVILLFGIVTRKKKLAELVKFTVESPAQDTKIEQVTCPKCKNVFGIEGIARPAKISCPECGLEGTVQ
jgi:hypothetical protein